MIRYNHSRIFLWSDLDFRRGQSRSASGPTIENYLFYRSSLFYQLKLILSVDLAIAERTRNIEMKGEIIAEYR